MKNNTIGKRIAEARINRNITQEHLEELSGLSVSTISRIETGKYMPTIENLLKLSEILDVGLDYFLYDLLPHNKDIQSPAIQDAISIMNQMGERQTVRSTASYRDVQACGVQQDSIREALSYFL